MERATSIIDECRALVRFLGSYRWPLSDEKRLQEVMAEQFAAAAVAAAREVDLGNGDIIDFMIGGVGMEVKIKGSKRAIYRQCERYCAHDRVEALILATNVATGMPATINGKPVLVALLGKGWL